MILIKAHDTWLNGKYLVCTISNEYGTVKSKNINLVVTDDYECSVGELVNIPIYEVGKGTDGWLYLYGTPTECTADHYYGTPWSLKFNSIKMVSEKRTSTQIDIKLNIKCSPSSEYSYDSDGHYHPCIGCSSFYDYIDYEEHRFQVTSLAGNTVTMKCSECGYDEKLTVYPYNASNIVYDGNEHKVDINKVTNKNGTSLTYYTDYRISYEENDDYKNAGIHKVYVKGAGKYSYTKAIEYEIKKKPVSGIKVTLSQTDFDYDGTQKTPTVTVKDSTGKTYKENVDYSVSWSPERVQAGTYPVSVYGIGNYDISGSAEFTITAKHTHSYEKSWEYDDSYHWNECECGDKKDITAHTFKWITDKAATTTEAGSKHEECTVCGYKKAAVTIDKLLDTTKPGGDTKPVDPAVNSIANAFGVDNGTAEKILQAAKDNNISDDTLKITEKVIINRTNDNDINGSIFGLLKAGITSVKKDSMKVKWSKVKNADGYIIYAVPCGKKNKLKRVGTVSAKTTSKTFKKVGNVEVTMSASKTIHATTTGGKFGVAKSVKINKIGTKKNAKKVTLKKGKSTTVKATEVRQIKNKKIQKHRGIKLESSNPKVAVIKGSKIIAKGKGKCTVYAYAQNGVYSKIAVTVK